MSGKLNKFKDRSVEFIEAMDVAEGVECDVYKFVNDDSCDLGIIRIKPGCETPRQIVLKGDKTVEGYISGEGGLSIISADGTYKKVAAQNGLEIVINIGESMQWIATDDSELVAYEICYPPYEPGRFRNLS